LSATESLLREIVRQNNIVLQELEFIRANTRAEITGEAADAGWDIKNYGTNFGTNLPGRPNNILNPGDEVTVIAGTDDVGQVIVASLACDNPFVTSNFQTKSPLNTWNDAISLCPFVLDQAGLNSVNDRVPFNTRYDTLVNAYGSAWFPNLKLGYHNGIILTISNPTTNLATGAANTAATINELLIVRVLYNAAQTLVEPSNTSAQMPKSIQQANKQKPKVQIP